MTKVRVTAKAVALCEDWIGKFGRPLVKINPSFSSYGLKHQVEAYARENGPREYVPQAAFTKAAKRLGYRAVPIAGTENYRFNMSIKAWIKSKRRG